jgi:imidazolonepropionase-like amidohydrolase
VSPSPSSGRNGLPVTIRGGLVYDVDGGSFSRVDVSVSQDRIVALEDPSRGATGRSIDAAGLFLLPGLIDCHVHLVLRSEDPDPSSAAERSDQDMARYAAGAAERTLAAGVTTVRDVGGWNHVEMSLRDAIERGRAVGPRLVVAGKLLSRTTPAAAYYPGMYRTADGTAAVREAVREQAARGAGVIKLMASGAILSPEGESPHESQYSLEEIAAAVDEAGQFGLPVAAHAHAAEGIENAVTAGVASIEHGTLAHEAILREMARRGTFLVPTSSTDGIPEDGPMWSMMPEHLRRRFLEFREIHARTVRLARRLGVPIAMGTDAGTPGNHHGDNAGECVLLVEQSGMTPAESLRSATRSAAALIGRAADLGAIEPGKLADVIGVEANPLDDIAALRRVALVMKAGVVYKPAS